MVSSRTFRSTATVVEVRPAAAADEDPLARLDRAAWTTYSSPGPLPESERFFGEKTKPEDVLVAVVDGEVAGYLRLARSSRFSSSDHVLSINGVAVDPAKQRRGLGRALIDAAVLEARRRGARRLTLRVFSPNAAARALYESAGFEVEGVLRGEFFLGGDYVDDIAMAIDLTSGR
jgi:ribosomal protein S18 acetylase RimI-like enzyme